MKITMNLKSNYKLVPAGERILEITKAECKPSGKPNNMAVTFKDTEGGLIYNKYDFERASYQLGILCSTALGLKDGDEFDTKIDTPKLVGKKLLCEVVHNLGTKENENGEVPTFANIKKIISLVDETTGEVQENNSPRNSIIADDLD